MSKNCFFKLAMVFLCAVGLGACEDPCLFMTPDQAVLCEWEREYECLPEAALDPDIALRLLEGRPPTSLDLSALQTTPAAERSQGSCGSCWGFASTLAVEILSDQAAWKQPLSVQFLVSNYQDKSNNDKFACCGGTSAKFAKFYNEFKRFIPSTNKNARYADNKTKCINKKEGTSVIPAADIGQEPSFSFEEIRCQSVSKAKEGMDTKDFIRNIKNVLLQKKPVLYSLKFSKDSSKSFKEFWKGQGESEGWNPDPFNGQEYKSGHLMCIVGYDDQDGTWLVENSWGAPDKRPKGILRIPQTLDYTGRLVTTDGDGESKYYTTHTFTSLSLKLNNPCRQGQ